MASHTRNSGHTALFVALAGNFLPFLAVASFCASCAFRLLLPAISAGIIAFFIFWLPRKRIEHAANRALAAALVFSAFTYLISTAIFFL